AELVVQDTTSYQKLIELAERAERTEALRASVEEMRAGKGIPAVEVLAEMRRILAEKHGR
ncbi:MAG: prevent-host-death protein, partial [Actinobacteria bacterium]|nr:prevent-host-death protein [Actinomycetota bacterium]